MRRATALVALIVPYIMLWNAVLAQAVDETRSLLCRIEALEEIVAEQGAKPSSLHDESNRDLQRQNRKQKYATKKQLDSVKNSLRRYINSVSDTLSEQVDSIRGGLENQINEVGLSLADTQNKLDSELDAVQNTLSGLSGMLACISPDSDEEDLIFSGCNVHLRNGLSRGTPGMNGFGNFIVGYNEFDDACIGCQRSGSHNIIVGENHDWTSYGGIVGGKQNRIRGPNAAVLGGFRNEATGVTAAIVGGGSNIAHGRESAIVGGNSNQANGIRSAVLGGYTNTCSGPYTSIAGGHSCTANNLYSSVLGGRNNQARGAFSTILGSEDIFGPETNADISPRP